MTAEPRDALRRLKRKYLMLRSGEILLIGLSVSCLAFAFISLSSLPLFLNAILSVLAGAAIFTVVFVRSGLHRFHEDRIITFIDKRYPIMQHSTDLLFKDPAGLTSLQQLQAERIRHHFPEIVNSIQFPLQQKKAVAIFCLLIILSSALIFFFQKDFTYRQFEQASSPGPAGNPATSVPAGIRKMTITVNPPPYTGIKSYSTSDPNLSIPEGSRVTWEISFTGAISNAQWSMLRGDSMVLTRTGQEYRTSRSFVRSGIYQVLWLPPSGEMRASDFYKIEIIRDQPPGISVSQPREYTQVRLSDKSTIRLEADLSDDHGLTDAYIIATVSKGSGESVKFREEKFAFNHPRSIRGTRLKAATEVDLLKLGMEPGDELYFYVEALDNKRPASNRARSSTFFIAAQDTASQSLYVEAGLGVDLMPVYFRSQRQIIIDTEKLIKERKSLSPTDFKARSNELGHDQKMLRLKYGAFLGEEFEETIGPSGELHEDNHEEHDHEDPIAAYTHVHDDAEEATFFTQSIRSKLKSALASMWDAELHLRTFHPEQSLPHQYKALKQLKEISQASRIYVHRSGFDPPPLKEDRRLTADLSDIRSARNKVNTKSEPGYPAIRSALKVMEEVVLHQEPLTVLEKQALMRAGEELATLAIDQPGNYLHALSLIKALNEDDIPSDKITDALLVLRETFWRVLPRERESPGQAIHSLHPLNQSFLENLKSLQDD